MINGYNGLTKVFNMITNLIIKRKEGITMKMNFSINIDNSDIDHVESEIIKESARQVINEGQRWNLFRN